MRIPAAESQVMEALWRRSPLTVDELIAELSPSQNWGPATVKTLVNRLLKKKAISSERGDGRQLYRPLVAREDYVQVESQNLLDRLFDGQLTPLVAHFASRRDLKPEDVERLKRLIEELDHDR